MSPTAKNLFAVIVGLFVGSAVNMGIVMISGSVIPPPEGADVTTMEGLEEAMKLFEPKHFIMPYLAHAIGTFAGALMAALFAVNYKMIIALSIGVFFLSGGIAMVVQLPSPGWFIAVDLALAYIPMGYLAGRIATRKQKK